MRRHLPQARLTGNANSCAFFRTGSHGRAFDARGVRAHWEKNHRILLQRFFPQTVQGSSASQSGWEFGVLRAGCVEHVLPILAIDKYSWTGMCRPLAVAELPLIEKEGHRCE